MYFSLRVENQGHSSINCLYVWPSSLYCANQSSMEIGEGNGWHCIFLRVSLIAPSEISRAFSMRCAVGGLNPRANGIFLVLGAPYIRNSWEFKLADWSSFRMLIGIIHICSGARRAHRKGRGSLGSFALIILHLGLFKPVLPRWRSMTPYPY